MSSDSMMITSDVAAAVPSIWATRILGYMPQYLSISRAVTNINDYAGEGTFRVGSTIHLPGVGSLSAGSKSEGSGYTFQEPSLADNTLTLNQHDYVAFGVEKRALSLVNQDIVTPQLKQAAQLLAEKVDTYLFSLYGSIGGGQTVTASGDSGVISRADLIAARQILRENRVAPSETLYGVMDFGSEATLLSDTNVTQWLALGVAGGIANAKIGDGTAPSVFPSSIGRAYGIDLAASGLVPVTTADSVDTSHNLVFSKDAIVWACRPMFEAPAGMGVYSATETDPESGLSVSVTTFFDGNLGALKVTAEILFGAAFLRPTHAVLINATTSV